MKDNDNKEKDRNAGLFAAIFCSITIIIFAFLIIENYIFRQNAVFTTGKVVSHSEYKKGDKTYNFTPIIEYKVGEMILKTEGNSDEKKEDVDKIGEEISICYNPKYPQDCRLGSFKDAYQTKLLLLVSFSFLLILAIRQYQENKIY
jgi:hypothetical protein